MRFRIELVCLLLVSFVLFSCQISGLTSGYSHLSKAEQRNVVYYNGEIADIRDFSSVYCVTVGQVRKFIATHDKVLIYDYTPYCKGPNCVSPASLSRICKQQKVDLLVISNIFDDVFYAVNKDFPILMINTKAYDTNRRSKYLEAFYKDLTGLGLKDTGYASYHYFSNGAYVKSFLNVNKSDFQ